MDQLNMYYLNTPLNTETGKGTVSPKNPPQRVGVQDTPHQRPSLKHGPGSGDEDEERPAVGLTVSWLVGGFNPSEKY